MAGHEPWLRFLQNLLASCETDWVEKYPSHVVASWFGHSPKVAAQHYLMSREHHFEDVVRGKGAGRPDWGTATAPECDAQCDALSTDRVELLARTVLLVADMAIPEEERTVVLFRVVARMVGQLTPCEVAQFETTAEPPTASPRRIGLVSCAQADPPPAH